MVRAAGWPEPGRLFGSKKIDGIYPTGDVTPDMLKEIEAERKTAHDAQLELNI